MKVLKLQIDENESLPSILSPATLTLLTIIALLNLALLTFWTRQFLLWGTVLCIIQCFAGSLAPYQ